MYERYVSSAARERAHGDALFHGRTALPGWLAGHNAPLAAAATRCSNCHEALSVSPVPAVATPGRDGPSTGSGSVIGTAPSSYATALDRVSLEQLRSRRGGPPSRFDATSLCTLLRSGVDPAQVMIPSTMPRYQPTDPQCTDLWAYLATR